MPYTERGAIEPLRAGETVQVRGRGNSMTPLIVSGEVLTIEPLKSEDVLRRGDVVLAKVKGRVYIHLVHGLRADQVQIGNNHGHINGWTPRQHIYGRWLRER